MENDYIKEVQKRSLTLFKVFAVFCKEHNLKYYAWGGTLLGAIRHNGFIPWDDDLDVAMPIDDYEKFAKLFAKSHQKDIGFIEYPWIGGKIFDKNSTLVEPHYLTNTKKYIGTFIDIFPLIGIPTTEHDRDIFMDRMRSFNADSLIFERFRNRSPKNKEDILKEQDYLLHKNSLRNSKFLTSFSFGFNSFYEKEWFEESICHIFEDTEIIIPKQYDSILRIMYGTDYMTPRKTGSMHSGSVFYDFKKPFNYYIKKYNNLDSEVKRMLDQEYELAGKYYSSLLYANLENSRLRKNIRRLEQEKQEILNSGAHKIGILATKPLKFFRKKA